jgi:DNA/RNA-binding domain of Phe-tRNA-synthetase-like protein
VRGFHGFRDGGGRVESVDLIQVDVVGAEPAQRVVKLLEDRAGPPRPGRRRPVPEAGLLEKFLADGHVDAAVFALRPDYRAMLLAVDGLVPGPSDPASEALLQAAEAAARQALHGRPAEELPHVAAWRDAYRAFGAKPQRTRNSLEALLRRAPAGLPRVNRLTDLYNAVCVLHRIPLGGRPDPLHWCAAAGPRDRRGAVRYRGRRDAVIEHPDPGEVVWCDDAGVTCRRWNWRQARRTQLREDTTAALFILDALGPVSDQELYAAADDLAAHLTRFGPGIAVARRVIAARRDAR